MVVAVVKIVLATGLEATPNQFTHCRGAAWYMMLIPPRIDKLNFIRF